VTRVSALIAVPPGTTVTPGGLKLGTEESPDNKFTVPVGVTTTRFALALPGDEHVTWQI